MRRPSSDAILHIRTLEDEAFNRWLMADFTWLEQELLNAPGDDVLEILDAIRAERLGDVEMGNRTLLFLSTYEATGRPTYEIVDAKPHLEAKQRREAARAEGQRRGDLKRAELQQRRDEHADLITEVGRKSILQEAIPQELINQLREFDLLTGSTAFRSGALHPGETYLLDFVCVIDGIKFAGMVGFDEEYQPISLQSASVDTPVKVPEYELHLYKDLPKAA